MDVVSSALAQLFVIPLDGSSPIPLAVVEDCRIGKRYASEILHGLGTGVGVDGVINTEQGTVSWGKVHQTRQEVLDAIAPRIATWTEFGRFNLLVVNAQTGKGIAVAVGVVPDSLDLTFQNGRAARENYQGQCQFVQLGEETAEAA